MDRLLLSSLAVVVCLSAVSTACPDRPVMQKLNLDKFAGRWYGIMGPMKYGWNYKCGYQVFTPRSDGVVSWMVRQFNTTTDDWEMLHGEISQIDNTGEFVGFRIGIPGGVKWHVLGTDYHRWAITWACHESNDVEFSYLLSREPEMSSQLQKEVSKILPDLPYETMDQKSCPLDKVPKWLPSMYLRR